LLIEPKKKILNVNSIEDKIATKYFDKLDKKITEWMGKYGLLVLRVCLGIIFLWFGILKFFKGLSPAEDLVRNTIYFMDPDIFIPILALWESLIGLGLITGKYMRLTLLLLFLQMPGTALPLIILPEKVWTIFPYGLTLEGQYIIKNLVLISAGLVLGATVRGGKIVSFLKE
jgi:uncharacterized membrane protein YphA (DoxX/SURF4 family)